MNIVAIYNFAKDRERLSKELAAVLGKTVYEARSRLCVPGGGPSVIAVFQDDTKAEDCAEKLRAKGFDTVVLRQEDIESDRTRFPARKFEFTGDSLYVESLQMQDLILPYHDIGLMLYGTGIAVHNENETVKERKFSIGRALVTSGVVVTKSESHNVRTGKEEHERFLYIYAPEQQIVVFRENALQYNSLGKALQPSRTANFNHVVTELRRLSPRSSFDDRLMNRGSQVQILGPLFKPEEHLDIATSLLARLLRPF